MSKLFKIFQLGIISTVCFILAGFIVPLREHKENRLSETISTSIQYWIGRNAVLIKRIMIIGSGMDYVSLFFQIENGKSVSCQPISGSFFYYGS
jgi:fumarate reductase subunit D